jgi:hypothetical protein
MFLLLPLTGGQKGDTKIYGNFYLIWEMAGIKNPEGYDIHRGFNVVAS